MVIDGDIYMDSTKEENLKSLLIKICRITGLQPDDFKIPKRIKMKVVPFVVEELGRKSKKSARK